MPTLGPSPAVFALYPEACRIWEGGPSSNCWTMRYASPGIGWELDGGNGLVLYRMSSTFDCNGPNVFDQLVRDWTAQAPPSITVWPFSPAPCNCPDSLGPEPAVFNLTAKQAYIHGPVLGPSPAYLRLNAGPFPGSGGGGVSKFTAIADTSTSVGSAVRVSTAGHVDLAQADAGAHANLIGLALQAVGGGDEVEVQTEGIVTLSEAEWDAIAGTTGGLAANAYYYLSTATPGLLTATRPTAGGEYIVVAGVGLSATQMELRIEPPLLL